MQRQFPDVLPDYTITPSTEKPFAVVWEELMGWFIIPRLGMRRQWAMYDFPDKRRTESFSLEVVGRASVHGIEGVEIVSEEANNGAPAAHQNADTTRTFVAQLTDTHCRILSETHSAGGVKHLYTFLDGDAFLQNWGFGPDNCGKETHIVPRGIIRRTGDGYVCEQVPEALDVVGRFTVTLGGKAYDTVCVMDVEQYETGIATLQYIDETGQTVLWRRFNRDDWAMARYKQPWAQRLPHNERITVNGQTYVHWYDCVTDYIL